MKASLLGLFETVCVLGLAGTWLGTLGRWHWFLDLFSHFRPQYVLVSVVMLILALLARRRWLGGLALISLIWNAWAVLSVHDTSAGRTAKGPALRLMTFNVLTSNPTPEAAIRHVLEADADILCLLEADTGWDAFLEPLRAKYPHRVEELPHGNFSIAVYARVKVTGSRILWLDEDLPSVQLDFEHAGEEVTLIATHALPPMARENARRWHSQLENTAKLAASIPHQVIIAGDLNATPWCEGMRLLKAGSGLDFRSQAAVWKPTWGLRGPVMMPIDHVLMKSGLMVTKRTIGEDCGSDHRSVLVDIRRELPME